MQTVREGVVGRKIAYCAGTGISSVGETKPGVFHPPLLLQFVYVTMSEYKSLWENLAFRTNCMFAALLEQDQRSEHVVVGAHRPDQRERLMRPVRRRNGVSGPRGTGKA